MKQLELVKPIQYQNRLEPKRDGVKLQILMLSNTFKSFLPHIALLCIIIDLCRSKFGGTKQKHSNVAVLRHSMGIPKTIISFIEQY